jgi:predicted cupin superfamily sugar epimerase
MDEFIHRIIEKLGLQPLPVEGGLFCQSYKSSEAIPQSALPERYLGQRSFGTAIYYLLTDDPDSFSALHRLTTDEVYHFYLGDPVEMLLLHPTGESERVALGQDILAGQKVQFVVPRGSWQGSHLAAGEKWALIGTTMAPGYEQADFELGIRAALLGAYPQEADLIARLTRE